MNGDREVKLRTKYPNSSQPTTELYSRVVLGQTDSERLYCCKIVVRIVEFSLGTTPCQQSFVWKGGAWQ